MIYLLCGLILIAAVPLTWMLKRDAEQSWRRHQELTQPRSTHLIRLAEAFIDVQIVLADRFTPALRTIGDELARLESSLRDGDVR
jgi:hypothetical protein